MVEVGRAIGRKQAFEMALTGDTIDANTALQWGLVNRVVPLDELESATLDLLERATRGSAMSKAIGKRTLFEQLAMDQHQAYSYAVEVMAAASQTADAQEGMASFLEKRHPKWVER
jgi:enoyl-CoA hydratase/carnithine racemase